MAKTRRSARKLPMETSADSLQQDLPVEQPSMTTEGVSQNKTPSGPSLKIKFMLPLKKNSDKPDETVQPEDGHSLAGSELPEWVREQPHRSGM
jgi:hypothetical protein